MRDTREMKAVGLFWQTADGKWHFSPGSIDRGDIHDNGRPIHIAYMGEEALKDGWKKWEGGKCPIGLEDTCIDVCFRNGIEHTESGIRAGYWMWTHNNEEDDIIAYRLHERKPCSTNTASK